MHVLVTKSQFKELKDKIQFDPFDNIPLFHPIRVSEIPTTQEIIFSTRLDACNHMVPEQLNSTCERSY